MSCLRKLPSRQWQRYASFILLMGFSGVVSSQTAPASIQPKADQSLIIDIEKTDNGYIAVGERGHILYSENGENFKQVAVPVNQMLNGVSFADSLNGWAVGFDGHIVASSDGGKTWRLQRNGLISQQEKNVRSLAKYNAEEINLQKKLASTAITDDEKSVLVTQLDDVQWEIDSLKDSMADEITTPPLLDVWFQDRNVGWAVGAFGVALKTIDGGESWQDISEQLNNDMGFHLNAVQGFSNGVVVIVGEAGFVVTSNNGGETFKTSDLGYEGTLFGLDADHSGKTIVTTGLRGKTFVSQDQGQTWQNVSPQVGFSLSGVEFLSEGTFLLVGHGGTLAFTEDSGMSYKILTLPSRIAVSNAVKSNQDGFVLVGQGGIHTLKASKLQ